ncbi:MAG: hypothetical protein Fur0024_2470 [Patescibacteria group bacterium]
MPKVERNDNQSLEALLRSFRNQVASSNIQSKAAGNRRTKILSRVHRKKEAIFKSNIRKKNQKIWLKV